MTRPDWPDLLAGILFLVTGAFVVGYATAYLPLGTLRRMGPGMFPLLVGCGLLLFGGLLAVPALARRRAMPSPDLRALVAILVGIAAFAASVGRLGLVPAILLLVALVSLASGPLRPGRVILLGGLLCGLAYVVFVVVLDAPLAMVRMPV